MTRIDISEAKAVVRRQEILTVGRVGAPVEFVFDESWNGLTKTAVFRQGKVVRDVVGIGDVETIPPEVLQVAGMPVEIGVYGTNKDGTIVIPTVWVKTNPVQPGADPSGDESTNPELPVWAQMQAEIEALEKNGEDLAADVVSLKENGEQMQEEIDDANALAEDAKETADDVSRFVRANMVIGEASGESIELENAADQPLVGLRIFGKTTQNGTPTPDAPFDLVSSSDGESISIHVNGKNLFTGWIVGGITTSSGEDSDNDTMRRTDYLPIYEAGQSISISGIPNTLYNRAAFYDADKNYLERSGAGSAAQRVITAPASAKYFRFTIYESSSTTGVISEADAMAGQTMIEAGDTVTSYERGKTVQAAAISAPRGLRGIPVTTGGNYTDENGQQWICDEIDLTRGVYISRVKETVLTAEDYTWYLGAASQQTENTTLFYCSVGTKLAGDTNFLCNRFPVKYIIGAANDFVGACGHIQYKAIYVRLAGVYTLEEFLAWLEANPISIVYEAGTHVETALSAEDIAAFQALRTYRDHAIISNTGFANMEIEYVMDTRKYIDSLVAPAARVAYVDLPASAWVGEGTLYSQVVAIAGVTENSQVNLAPSVEQLSIFYEKDITFVTENDGGVVTVYVIGQKPQNDYTIQADIVEVIV